MITVDAIKKSSEADQIPLRWVGMEKVTLSVLVNWSDGEANLKTNIIADFNIFVNLVNPSKGIHMSRLYELLTQYTQKETLTLSGVRLLLSAFVQSQNGLSTQAKISLSFAMPVTEQTLKSEKFYLKTVPLIFDFVLADGIIKTEMKFKMDYSSTCPQSAALAHQLTIHEFEKQFDKKNATMTAAELTQWYSRRGFVATPHAQRSELNLMAVVRSEFELLDFANLFLGIEQSLGTPTQGIVKREDEQEFARLNASNLMFCEDAARKLTLFLKRSSWLVSGRGKVSHLESLHSHNAVAYFDF